uniref:Putative dna-dependent rna polymerase i n=1 Tax=Corethrella appendiculata TaxID=1370023 RepID=U5ETT7_9DIPT
MHKNNFTKYIKYTKKELEQYVSDKNACVVRINKNENLALHPKFLSDVCEGVRTIVTEKIGKYDQNLDGIVLDFKNTKIISPLSAIRFDNPFLHLSVQTDFYVFKPEIGSVINGIVTYISKNYLSVVIYRVFNVTIRLDSKKIKRNKIQHNSEISCRVKKFDLNSELPYIEGELIDDNISEMNSFENDIDSGISTEENIGNSLKRRRENSTSQDESELEEEFVRPVKVKAEKVTDSESSDSDDENVPKPIKMPTPIKQIKSEPTSDDDRNESSSSRKSKSNKNSKKRKKSSSDSESDSSSSSSKQPAKKRRKENVKIKIENHSDDDDNDDDGMDLDAEIAKLMAKYAAKQSKKKTKQNNDESMDFGEPSFTSTQSTRKSNSKEAKSRKEETPNKKTVRFENEISNSSINISQLASPGLSSTRMNDSILKTKKSKKK